MPQVTGSLISLVRDLCHDGLLDWSPRIMLAMYSCEIQASSTSHPLTGFFVFHAKSLTDSPNSRCLGQSVCRRGEKTRQDRLGGDERGYILLLDSRHVARRGEFWIRRRYVAHAKSPAFRMFRY